MSDNVNLDEIYEPTSTVDVDLNPLTKVVRQPPTLRHRLWSLILRLLTPVGEFVSSKRFLPFYRFLPSLPRSLRVRSGPPDGPWNVTLPPIPSELLSVPGSRKDEAEEERARTENPLVPFYTLYARTLAFAYRRIWPALMETVPTLMRSRHRVDETRNAKPAQVTKPLSPDSLTRSVKQLSDELGISALGVTRYDPRYVLANDDGDPEDRVIVAALEQNHGATQAAPSVRSNRAALLGLAEASNKLVRLAEYLHAQGYRAVVHGSGSDHILMIPLAEAAGLGQLGLNGQLLTPAAGSRCRLAVILTDAPLDIDSPVDYGLHGICDRCQVCVRRCPAGAIPNRRRLHRGVEKAKLNRERCFPVVSQMAGCQLCMKVCPVQRFGLPAVLETYVETGEILGKGTDGLEGYDWMGDGRHYGPGERPYLPPEFFRPEGTEFAENEGPSGVEDAPLPTM